MHDMPQVVARNLRRLRQEMGISQEELAHRADIDRTYVSALERAKYNPTVGMIGRLAEALGVLPARLLQLPSERPRAGARAAGRQRSRVPPAGR